MGWWNSTSDGESLQSDDTGIVWGDAPADILGDAIDAIIQVFKTELGRPPTKVELRAGLEFTLGGFDSVIEHQAAKSNGGSNG